MEWLELVALLVLERLLRHRPQAAAEHREAIHSVPERLPPVREALGTGRDVRIVYFAASSGELTERVVTPKRIARRYAGDWYLEAWDHLREADRTFRVSRIRELQIECVDRTASP